MKKGAFWEFSFLVERYYIEAFTLETLFILALFPALRLIELIVIASAMTVLITEGLKFLIRETRPDAALERHSHGRLFRLNLRSFPSTHSAVAFMFAGLMFNSALFIPLLFFGSIIAYSRVYIKSHYAHDVIAGAAIGFFIGYAILRL